MTSLDSFFKIRGIPANCAVKRENWQGIPSLPFMTLNTSLTMQGLFSILIVSIIAHAILSYCRRIDENGLSAILSGSSGTAAYFYQYWQYQLALVESELLFLPLPSDDVALATWDALVRVSLS